MVYRVTKKDKTLRGTICLPASKSESNRALIIRALSRKKFDIKNLSGAGDTRILDDILNSSHKLTGLTTFNAGAAGTAMRFLTAFFSVQQGKEVILTGTERMKERPVKILAEALRELGADIEYIEKPGFPPLKIKGKNLDGGKITVDGSISSQYISALLMIAPVLKNGLEVKFKGEIISNPYIEMTLKMMKHFGIEYKAGKTAVTIEPHSYQPKDFTVEADWSAASYWYEMAAFSEETDLKLPGLKKESLQGDSAVAVMFEPLGIVTDYEENGIQLLKKRNTVVKNEKLEIDFADCPDLAQTLAVTCAGMGIAAHLKGLKTLRIKETDRVNALHRELKKTEVTTEIRGDDLIIPPSPSRYSPLPISTYDDHRMAMAFAPLAMKYGEVSIENPEVVKKSYPGFWKDIESAGFEISEA